MPLHDGTTLPLFSSQIYTFFVNFPRGIPSADKKAVMQPSTLQELPAVYPRATGSLPAKYHRQPTQKPQAAYPRTTASPPKNHRQSIQELPAAYQHNTTASPPKKPPAVSPRATGSLSGKNYRQPISKIPPPAHPEKSRQAAFRRKRSLSRRRISQASTK